MAGFSAPESDLVPAPGGGKTAFGDPILGATPAVGRKAQDIGDAIISGLQNSAIGLALRGKMPSQVMGEDAPWYQRLAANAAGVVADIPLSIAAAIPAVPSGPIGMGAAGFAAPMALREGLIEAYSGNHALSWAGVWDIAKAALVGGTKGAAIGAATMGAGRFAGAALGPTATTGARTLTSAGAELATLTTTSAALEGHMPTAQDFMDNAILLGGMKGAMKVASGLRNIYVETGKTPVEVLNDAAKNPVIKEQLAKGEPPAAYAPLALEQRVKAALDTDPRPEQIRETLASKAPAALTPADPGFVKWEYVTDLDTAKGVLREVTANYQSEIETQRRGVVSNEQTAIDGLRLVADGKLADHVAGQAFNDAQVYGIASMLKSAANNAARELQALAAIPAADVSPMAKLKALAAIEQVSMLNAEFAGARAEAGRALQVFRAIKSDPSYLGEAEAIVKLAERKGNLQDIARMAAGLKDPAQMAKFAEKYSSATTMEMFIEGQKAFWLSGPQTHLANLMGNAAKWVIDVPESALSASLYALDRAAKGDPLTMAQFKARAFSPILGLQMGARDALTVAAEALRGQGDHLEKVDIYRTAIPGTAGEVIRTPFRFLQAEDAIMRIPAERAQAYIMAVDRAAKEGLHPDTAEFRAAAVKYTQEPTLGLTDKAAVEAMAKIEQAGAEAVFSQRLGPRMEMLQRSMAGHWSSLVVPFIRTPANLVSWAIQHIPGLNVMSGRWREDFAAGGERQAKAVARVVIGTGIATIAYSLADADLLTGGGMFDKEQRGTKNAAGWQPYSVKVGDTYYSYQRMEPAAKVLGIAADLIELSKKSKDEEDKGKIAAMLVLMFGNATVSTTYLSGLSNTINAVTDPERYGGNLIEQYASGLVPKIIGQPTAMADPYKREVDGALEAIQSQIPFLREKLLPKRDVWGEPSKNSRWFEVMPVATSEISQDKVRTEAMRLAVAISDAPKFLMERGPFNPKDERVKLTGDQRDIFKEISGKNAMTILAPIVNAPDWERTPDFAKAAIYKSVIEGTRKQGQYAALPPDDAARVQLRQKIVDKIIQQTNEAQGDTRMRYNKAGERE